MPFLSADTPMYDLLRLFKTGRSHMVMLTKPTSATAKQRRTKPLQAKPELQVVHPMEMQGAFFAVCLRLCT